MFGFRTLVTCVTVSVTNLDRVKFYILCRGDLMSLVILVLELLFYDRPIVYETNL